MSRFPEKSMRAMRAKFPEAEKFVQLRIFADDGSTLSIEGPITKQESELLGAAVGKIFLRVRAVLRVTASAFDLDADHRFARFRFGFSVAPTLEQHLACTCTYATGNRTLLIVEVRDPEEKRHWFCLTNRATLRIFVT